MKTVKYRFENVKCVRVIDGDSIVCDIDLGFYIHLKKVIFRLKGINAPEIKGKERPEGLKAKEWLKKTIKGKNIVLETYKGKERGKYGRYLADVYIGSANVNKALVIKDLAEEKEY